MKRALIRNSLIALVILVLITGVSSYLIMKNALTDNAYDETQARLDGFVYLLQKEKLDDINQSCKDFGKYTGIRVTVVDALTGQVLGDSDNDITTMDNHLYREEISQAINDGSGSSMRHSDTQKIDFLYYAKYLELDGRQIVVRTATELDVIKDVYNSLGVSMLIAVLASALIAFLITYGFNNRVAKPISEITDLALEISEGSYGKSAYITSYKEVEKLSGALNKLSKSLKISFDNISVRNAQLEAILQSFNHGIMVCDNDGNVQYSNENFSKVLSIDENPENKNIYKFMFDENIYSILEEILKTEENSVTRENVQFADGTFRNYSGYRIKDNAGVRKGILLMVEDVTNVRKLERMRSTFVSNVTHELKTPITCISGYTQTLLNGAMYDKDNASKFLHIIDEEAQRLNLLIDDILTLSEIENKRNVSYDTKVDLVEIAQEVLELMKQKYPGKSELELRIDTDGKEPYEILGDKHKLKQIVINLVDNSIKHTSQGFIAVKFSKDDNSLTMKVQDTGVGIEEKHHDRLFERFYRVDKHRSRESGGTGLGLSIVKHLTLLHHGHISIESKLGQGTSISIEFPLPENG